MRATSSRPDVGGPDATEIAAACGELGLALTPIQLEQLARYAALLRRWNAVHNLTSRAEPSEIISGHLLDSLAILPTIAAICDEEPLLLDVGTGAGLPGIPIAVARPGWRVTMIDKVQKKIAFVTQAVLELRLENASCVHGRVEELALPPFSIIISRALSSLVDFTRMTRHLLARDGCWVAMKGARPDAELAELAIECPDVELVDTVKLAVPRLSAERHLILLRIS